MPSIAPSSRPSSRRLWLIGAAVLVLVVLLGGLCYAIVTGMTRQFGAGQSAAPSSTSPGAAAPPVAGMSSRQLDGLTVSSTHANLRPWAFMIDNQADARPAEGLSSASVVIEAPVEGGITRLLAIFDPMTTSTVQIGAVRSARPYFVEWASSWKAVYGHVGGSPEALSLIPTIPSSTLLDANEMTRAAKAYRRDPNRIAPHQVLTTPAKFSAYLGAQATSTVRFSPWRYTATPVPTSTVADAGTFRITYGGSYTTRWTYDTGMNQYKRSQAGKALARDDIYATNVIVIKTESRVLDDKGRLQLRTTGGGEAIVYRDGKKLIGRWRRAAGDVMSFIGTDGSDIELRAGNTWIEVTTDDLSFAGLDA